MGVVHEWIGVGTRLEGAVGVVCRVDSRSNFPTFGFLPWHSSQGSKTEGEERYEIVIIITFGGGGGDRLA